MQPVTFAILKENYTREAALQTVSELRSSTLANLFGAKKTSSESPPKAHFLTTKLPPDFTKDNAEGFFAEIEDEIKSLKPLLIYLAIPLTSQNTAKICQKARSLFGQTTLLEIKSDPDLVAGCALSYNGIYKDYSLRPKLTAAAKLVRSDIKKWK